MQKRDFLKGSFAALGGFGFAGMAAAKSDIPEAKDITTWSWSVPVLLPRVQVTKLLTSAPSA